MEVLLFGLNNKKYNPKKYNRKGNVNMQLEDR